MSYVRTGVPSNLTDSALVNSIISGGTVWSHAYPVKIKPLDYDATMVNWPAFWAARGEVRGGDLVDHQSDVQRWMGTGNSQQDYVLKAAQAFSAVSNIQFTEPQTSLEADIVIMRTFGLSIMPRAQGRLVYGEGPSDNATRQTWGYIANGQQYAVDGPSHGDWDFFGAYNPLGGIGFQNILSLIAETIGLKVSNPGGFGAPYTLMSSQFVPENSNKSSGYGFMKTPGPIEIAAVQALYGAKAAATGNDVYVLPTKNIAGWPETTGWTTIWDTDGVDAISAQNSTNPVSINLNAASLDPNDPNGAGYLSRQMEIYGGFNIANGVVIEKAIGGSGNDLLVGNNSANTLIGGNGIDTLYGKGGKDAFRFTVKPSSKNYDKIYDYKKEDVIELFKGAFSKLKTNKGTLKSNEFWKGSAAHDRDDRIIFDAKKSVVYYDQDGTGKSKAVKIFEVKNKFMFTAGEFFVV
jgi:serralysin